MLPPVAVGKGSLPSLRKATLAIEATSCLLDDGIITPVSTLWQSAQRPITAILLRLGKAGARAAGLELQQTSAIAPHFQQRAG
jgi:hypothetical protein